jgi:hypothetical protein
MHGRLANVACVTELGQGAGAERGEAGAQVEVGGMAPEHLTAPLLTNLLICLLRIPSIASARGSGWGWDGA